MNGSSTTHTATTAQKTTVSGGNMTTHSHLYQANNTSDNKLCFNIMSFNCYGMKSSLNMIMNQMKSSECIFVCETWLVSTNINNNDLFDCKIAVLYYFAKV